MKKKTKPKKKKKQNKKKQKTKQTNKQTTKPPKPKTNRQRRASYRVAVHIFERFLPIPLHLFLSFLIHSSFVPALTTLIMHYYRLSNLRSWSNRDFTRQVSGHALLEIFKILTSSNTISNNPRRQFLSTMLSKLIVILCLFYL